MICNTFVTSPYPVCHILTRVLMTQHSDVCVCGPLIRPIRSWKKTLLVTDIFLAGRNPMPPRDPGMSRCLNPGEVSAHHGLGLMLSERVLLWLLCLPPCTCRIKAPWLPLQSQGNGVISYLTSHCCAHPRAPCI